MSRLSKCLDRLLRAAIKYYVGLGYDPELAGVIREQEDLPCGPENDSDRTPDGRRDA